MERLRNARPWMVLAGGDFFYKAVMAVYWVLLARIMSVDGLGAIALANAIGMPAFVIIDAGLNAILVRDYSQEFGMPVSQHRRTIRRALTGLLMLVPLAGFGWLVSWNLEATLAVGLISVAYYFDFVGQLMLAPARAVPRMEPDAAVRAVQATGTVAITLGLLAFGLISPVWIALASTVAYGVAVIPAWNVWRNSRGWTDHPDVGRPETPDEVAVSHATVLMSVFWRGDSILVQVVLGPAALAAYTVALKLLEVARLLPGALSRIVLAQSSGEQAETYEPWRHIRTSVALGAVAGVGVILLAPYLIEFLFGDEYRESATGVVRIMGLSLAPFAVATAGMMYAIGIGQGATYRRIAAESVIAMLILVPILAHFAALEGAAAGMLVSQVFVAGRFWALIKRERTCKVAG